MCCQSTTKTFYLQINGETIHKLTVSLFLMNILVSQIYDNDKLLKIEQVGTSSDRVRIGGMYGDIPLKYYDLNETIRLVIYSANMFWKPHNRIMLFINGKNVENEAMDRSYVGSCSFACKKMGLAMAPMLLLFFFCVYYL